jgi:hypothetical protein
VLSQRLLTGDASGDPVSTEQREGNERTPAPPGSTPLCGVNVSSAGVYASRRADFGRIGVSRVFHEQGLPAKWTWAQDGLSDEKRVQVSFKTPPASLAEGAEDATIRSWLRSIPAGWTVWLTLWHEPGDELRDGGFSPAEFQAGWRRLSQLVRSDTFAQDVTIYLTPVFGRYLVDTASWSDAWVPAPSDVDLLSWDIYGNATGTAGLNSPYPDVPELVDTCLRVTERLGFQRWGVSEFNAPRRSWDAGESARVRWLEEFRSYCWSSSRGVAPQLEHPELFLLWEGFGTNWDQNFKTPATRAWWRGVLAEGA